MMKVVAAVSIAISLIAISFNSISEDIKSSNCGLEVVAKSAKTVQFEKATVIEKTCPTVFGIKLKKRIAYQELEAVRVTSNKAKAVI